MRPSDPEPENRLKAMDDGEELLADLAQVVGVKVLDRSQERLEILVPPRRHPTLAVVVGLFLLTFAAVLPFWLLRGDYLWASIWALGVLVLLGEFVSLVLDDSRLVIEKGELRARNRLIGIPFREVRKATDIRRVWVKKSSRIGRAQLLDVVATDSNGEDIDIASDLRYEKFATCLAEVVHRACEQQVASGRAASSLGGST